MSRKLLCKILAAIYHRKTETLVRGCLNPSGNAQSLADKGIKPIFCFNFIFILRKYRLSVVYGFSWTPTSRHFLMGPPACPSQEGFPGASSRPFFCCSLCELCTQEHSRDLPKLALSVFTVCVFSFTSLGEFYKPLPG